MQQQHRQNSGSSRFCLRILIEAGRHSGGDRRGGDNIVGLVAIVDAVVVVLETVKLEIVFEPELHLGNDILVPDLGGWPRETMRDYPDFTYLQAYQLLWTI